MCKLLQLKQYVRRTPSNMRIAFKHLTRQFSNKCSSQKLIIRVPENVQIEIVCKSK